MAVEPHPDSVGWAEVWEFVFACLRGSQVRVMLLVQVSHFENHCPTELGSNYYFGALDSLTLTGPPALSLAPHLPVPQPPYSLAAQNWRISQTPTTGSHLRAFAQVGPSSYNALSCCFSAAKLSLLF